MEMVWYTPLTILPAVGLLILSTSNFLVALNVEIYELEKDKELHKWIIGEKIKQLKRLGIANSFLYSSALIFMFSTFSMSIFNQKMLFHCMMITAVIFVTIALCFLFMHSVRAVQIRHKH